MIERFRIRPQHWQAAVIAVAASLAISTTLSAQTTQPTKKTSDSSGGYSTLDLSIFGGYQWFQFGQGTDAGVHQFTPAGAWGERLTEEFSKYMAVEEGLQLSYDGMKFTPLSSPSYTNSVSAHQTGLYAAGVFNLAPRESKYRPFFLIGPEFVWYGPPKIGNLSAGAGSPALILPTNSLTTTGRTALTYGIGLKINESKRWAVRFDLRGTRTGTPHYGLPGVASLPGTVYIAAGNYHESSLTASVGVTFRFRYYEPPPPPKPEPPHVEPPKANVTVGPITGARAVCAGDDLRLSVTASGWLPDQTPSYQWMINGNPVSGATSGSFSVPTANGTNSETVTVMVSAGGSSATSGAVTVTVNPLTPPTISFTISPSTVPYGTRVNLAATANGSTCGGPATIRYSGQGVTGTTFDSTALTFDMSNRLKQQSQTVTVTATATDQKNQTASATAPVTVTLTAQTKRLDDIVFPVNSSRVNNCAKRLLLEELTPMLRADPNAKVILIGHRDTGERVIKGKAPVQVDEARVLDAAAVLSAGKGICPSLDLSRVMVNSVGTDQTDEARPALCGTSTNVKERGGQGVKESDKRAEYRRVEIWFVPGGADTPANLTGLKPAPVKDIQAKGCPK
jgi:opacity protein-like surface antigen